MKYAANELVHSNVNKNADCGVSVDGTWQRREYTS